MTRVPPGARVLVALPAGGELPAAAHRELIPFAGGVEELEEVVRAGATHLAIPAVAAEWFEGEKDLRRHVRTAYPLVAEQPGEFALHSLLARRASGA